MAIISYIDAITMAMREEMERDPKVFVLGEDVGLKGGVFKATQGLYDQFGEERVIDTPLAESAIAGVGIGAAMYGMRPIAEMQFADFIMPAVNQIISEAAKIRY
ncbi:MAG: alpha-ketoacid dehydrogenase subunit beta, partial [Bacillus sp. (in: firmicutes)]